MSNALTRLRQATALWLILLTHAPALYAGPRIVSLSPHITEILFAAGAGDLLVGVAEFSDYPPQARLLPRIGGHGGIDYERILSLRPDLVVTWPSGNGPAVVDKLTRLGLRLASSDPRHILAIADDIERLGTLAGRKLLAKRAANGLRQRLADLRRNTGQPQLRVFYQIWDRPLMTINGQHILTEAIELCGGENIFSGLTSLTPQISREAVLLATPDIILMPASAETAARWQTAWQGLPGLANTSIRQLPPDLLQRPTPRMLDGIDKLCHLMQETRQQRQQSR